MGGATPHPIHPPSRPGKGAGGWAAPLPLVGPLPSGGVGRTARSPVNPTSPAPPPVTGAGSEDPRSSPRQRGRAAGPCRETQARGIFRGEGAAEAGTLPAAAGATTARDPLRACAAGPVAPPRHEETGAVLAGREAHPPGRTAAQSPRRLALPPRRHRRPQPPGL